MKLGRNKVTKKPRHNSHKAPPEVTQAKKKSDPGKVTAGEKAVSGPVIAIDGVEYDASNLTGPAEGALASLRFAEARLMALQSELAVCQTARLAYIKSLRGELGLDNEKK